MIKGGYKVIVFEGYTLTDTPVIIPGIYNTIQNNYEKMLVCSGVSSADYLYDDNVGFCTIGDDGAFEIQFGNQKIKISEDDEVTMSPSGGGGGGVSDYNDLTSKPKINDVTLTGNKSASDLGIQAAEQGKGLSTNDFTNALKSKLDSIDVGAEVNVQPDWNEDDSTKDDYIKNKPTIPEVKDNLSDLDDVDIFNPHDDYLLTYVSDYNKWLARPNPTKRIVASKYLGPSTNSFVLELGVLGVPQDALVDIYVSVFGISPTNITIYSSAHEMLVEFAPGHPAMTVNVVFWNV